MSIKGADLAAAGRRFPMLPRRDGLRLFGHFLCHYGNVKTFAFEISVLSFLITFFITSSEYKAFTSEG
jgi:hypothetical protein